uniref:Uncharacterized protein n=1 Tax=Macrophomina phaseolina fusagravirus 5 TaxID=2741671 RepID=A0A7S5WLW1_9VIRU|nr:hypothetical protein [Macrophomina phaseolina fusagravirus 5]
MFCNLQNAMAYEAGLNCFTSVALAQSLKKSHPHFIAVLARFKAAIYFLCLFGFLASPLVVLVLSFLPPALVFYFIFYMPSLGVFNRKNLVIPPTYESLRSSTPLNQSSGRQRLALTLKCLFSNRVPDPCQKPSLCHAEGIIPPQPIGISAVAGYSLFLQVNNNRLMHTLNGNIASLRPVQDFLSAAIPGLGGVRHVLTEYTTGVMSSNLKERWSPLRYPRQMTNSAIAWRQTGDREDIFIDNPNEYVRHFPEIMTNPQLPEYFVHHLKMILAFLRSDHRDHHHVIPTDFSRIWEPKKPNERPLQERFVGFAGVLAGALDHASLQAAERVGAINRFLDSRGNRQVAQWEAEQWGRWLRVSQFAGTSGDDFCYMQAAYRLWARWFTLQSGSLGGAGYNVVCPQPGTDIGLTFINARAVLGPNAPNPEGPMWTDDAQMGLQDGSKQFIDAEGLSEEELIELISVLAPVRSGNQLLQMESRNGVGPHQLYLFGPNRYLYDNGVDEIFIHLGNSAIPDAATQQRIRERVHGVSSSATVGSVIRYLATKHNAIKDLENGLEAVMLRGFVYKSNMIRNRRANLRSRQYINADGNWGLYLPRDKTSSAYFDALRVPLEPSPMIQYMLQMQPREVVKNALFLCHSRAVSLNWASYAISMLGQQWAARPGQVANQFVRNHIDAWLRRFGIENINLWSTAHANAMAHQYGFAPSPTARATEELWVRNWWVDTQAPYLANPYLELWLMELIPSHQLLPFYDKENIVAPGQEPGSPMPALDFASFEDWVPVSRDLSPFSGCTWMSDGGMTRNAQFYAAQGRNNQFRYEGGNPHFQLSRWAARFRHQAPQNTANVDIAWMGDLNEPFADFILPGSMPCLRMEANRVYAWGVTMTDHGDRQASRRWHGLSIGQGNNCLMINYVHPLKERREIEALQDYSIFIWEKDNKYTGMTAVRYDLPDVAAGARFDPKGVPAMPNYDIPAATGDEYMSVQPARITKNRKEVDAPPRTKVTKYLEMGELERTGELKYNPVYPTNSDQVPKLPDAHVVMDDKNIVFDPAPLAESRTPAERLAYLNEKLRETDDFQLELEAERSKLQQLRDEARQHQADIIARVAQNTRKHNEARRRFTNPNQATYLNPGMKKAAPAASTIDKHVVTVPNDANSGQMQAGVGALDQAFTGQFTMADELHDTYSKAKQQYGSEDNIPATDFTATQHKPVAIAGSLPRTVYANLNPRKRKVPEPVSPKRQTQRVAVPGQAQEDGSVSLDYSTHPAGRDHATGAEAARYEQAERALAPPGGSDYPQGAEGQALRSAEN